MHSLFKIQNKTKNVEMKINILINYEYTLLKIKAKAKPDEYGCTIKMGIHC